MIKIVSSRIFQSISPKLLMHFAPCCYVLSWEVAKPSLQWRRNVSDGVTDHRRLVYSTVCSGAGQRNINAPCHWPLWREFTGDRRIPLTKGQWRGNVSIWWRHHDFAMSSRITESMGTVAVTHTIAPLPVHWSNREEYAIFRNPPGGPFTNRYQLKLHRPGIR